MRPTNRLRILLCLLLAGKLPAAHGAERKVLHYAFEIAETGFDPAEISDLYSRDDVVRNIFDAPLRFAYLAAPGTLEPSTAAGLPEIGRQQDLHHPPQEGHYFTDDPAFQERRELTARTTPSATSASSIRAGTVSAMAPSRISAWWACRASAQNRPLRLRPHRRGPEGSTRPPSRSSSATRRCALHRISRTPVERARWREVVEKYGDDIMAHPVGDCPFRLVQAPLLLHRAGAQSRLPHRHLHGHARSQRCRRPAIARALDGRRSLLIDRVEISIIEEGQPRWLSFLNAEADFLDIMPRDMAKCYPMAGPAPNLVKKHIQIERALAIDVTHLIYNMDNPVLGGYTAPNIALRRAISLGFDTPEFIRTYMPSRPSRRRRCPGSMAYDLFAAYREWHDLGGTRQGAAGSVRLPAAPWQPLARQSGRFAAADRNFHRARSAQPYF